MTLLLLAQLLPLRRQRDIKEVLGYYLATGSVDLAYDVEIHRLAAKLTAGSRFQGRVNTRTPPTDGYLNIYVLRADPAHMFGEVDCNCAYIGSDVILCDSKFVASFTATLNFPQDPEVAILQDVNKSFGRFLLAWLLGHEIGHAQLHYSSLSHARWRWDRLDAQAWKLSQEREADEYVIAHLPIEDPRRASFTLLNLVFQIYSRAYAYNRSHGVHLTGGRILIHRSRYATHDPWVFRALTMAEVLERHSSLTRGDSDFSSSLRSKFVVSNEGYEVGALCDGAKLRVTR